MIYINENNLPKFNNNFCVVTDFDRTLTTSSSSGSWAILENPNFMDSNLQIDSHKLFEKYYPYELDYSLDDNIKSSLLEEWYHKNMDLLYKYNLTYDRLINCVKNSSTKLRDGAKDFLNTLNKKNIPVIILSAGIGNVIQEYLKLNDCLFNNISIISNFIEFKNNNMLPFKNKMIHTSNKCINLLSINDRNAVYKSDAIVLFGDLIEDLNMVSKDVLYKTLSFGFLEKNVEKNLELYKNSFDVVLTNNSSFYDVENILC